MADKVLNVTFEDVLEVIKWEDVINYEVHKSGDIKVIEIGCDIELEDWEYDVISEVTDDLRDMCSYYAINNMEDEDYYIFNGFMVVSHI